MKPTEVIERLESPIMPVGADVRASQAFNDPSRTYAAYEKRQRHIDAVQDKFYNDGMRLEAIARDMDISYSRVCDYKGSGDRQRELEERLKLRIGYTPPKEKVTIRRGLVTPFQKHTETPLQARGRFLDSEEGQDTLERLNQPYKPEKPEFLKFRNPPENPLLTYGGAA